MIKTESDKQDAIEEKQRIARAGLVKEFVDFLKKYGVIGLALGVVVGNAVKTLVDSIVNNLVNPLLGRILGQTNLNFLNVYGFGFGNLLNDFINFLVLMAIVFFAIRFFLHRFVTQEELKKI